MRTLQQESIEEPFPHGCFPFLATIGWKALLVLVPRAERELSSLLISVITFGKNCLTFALIQV